MPSKRRPDAIEQHELLRLMQIQQARSVREELPDVARVQILVSFEDFDQGQPPQPREIGFGPDSKAVFHLPCPHRECVMGGFNFSAAVRQAVHDRRDNEGGTLQCAGWQDRERVNKHRCYLTAKYAIHVAYAPEV